MQYDLSHLAQVFSQISDPRSKHGTYPPAAGILALTFLGLLASQNYFTHICRFKTKKPPNRTTISRLFAKISLNELQEAFAVFLSQLLQEQPLAALVRDKPKKLLKRLGLQK